MLQEICKFNQRGFCKFGIRCNKYHENDKCLDRRCTGSECKKRHPKVCRYFAEYNFCKFDNDCAFSHVKTVKIKEIELALEDLKNMKAEIDVLKNSFKSLSAIKQEGKVLKRVIDNLKEETKHLREQNTEITNRIKEIEEDLEDESDEESNNESETIHTPHIPFEGLFPCNHCGSHFGVRKQFEAHMKIHEGQITSNMGFKCKDCDYICENELTMKKHMNTRHPVNPEGSENIPTKSGSDQELESLDDMFQIEIVEGETIYACNICDEGLDSDDEVRKHIIANHREVISLIDSFEKDDAFENDEIEKVHHKECNDPKTCFRINDTKCLCFYDT